MERLQKVSDDLQRVVEQAKKLEESVVSLQALGREVTKDEYGEIGIEMDLVDLGTIFARLLSKGVSTDIVADTLINAAEKRHITEICSKFDAYLRAPDWSKK